MKAFVTGGAGFIGSTMVDRLLRDGHRVTAFDNLSTGQLRFLDTARKSSSFALVEGDVLDEPALAAAMAGHDIVFHFAANADVRFGTQQPRKDLEQNTIATANVLETMRAHKIGRIAFSSTGSAYGEPKTFPTPEDCPFPIQTSLYGASKVAAESMIAAYCEGFGIRSWIFRFVSILGERYTHGHVFDFYKQLQEHPAELTVLGDGQQRKSYLYVQDCVDAVLTAIDTCEAPVNLLNLGTHEYVQVNESIDVIVSELGLTPKRRYTGGARGWIGDSPFIFLDCARMRALGWLPKLTIRESVQRTVRWLRENEWVLSDRALGRAGAV